MTQPVFSPSQWGVHKAEQFFKVNEENNFAVKGLKVAGRALTNTALTAAALAETVVFAALTVVLSVTYFVHHNTFASLKERTTVAANTVKDAVKGIAGYYDSAKTAEAKVKAEHAAKFTRRAEKRHSHPHRSRCSRAKRAEARAKAAEARAKAAEAKVSTWSGWVKTGLGY